MISVSLVGCLVAELNHFVVIILAVVVKESFVLNTTLISMPRPQNDYCKYHYCVCPVSVCKCDSARRCCLISLTLVMSLGAMV